MSNAGSRRVGKLWSWHRGALYGVLGACALTGLAYWMLRDLLPREPAAFDHTVLVLHALASFLALMAFGSVLPTHVRATWRLKRNRWAGGATVALLALLALSAFGLYYAGEESHRLYKWSHLAAGLAGMLLVPLHIVVGRRSGAPH